MAIVLLIYDHHHTICFGVNDTGMLINSGRNFQFYRPPITAVLFVLIVLIAVAVAEIVTFYRNRR